MKIHSFSILASSLMSSAATEPSTAAATAVAFKGDCAICTESFSKTKRKAVSCGLCDHVACMTCTKTYLLQSVHQPHCMSCRKEWTAEFLNQTLPESFLKKEYRAMRETILFEEEKTFLPDLQDEAERKLTIMDIEKKMEVCVAEKWRNEAKEDQLVSVQRENARKLDSELVKYQEQCAKLFHGNSTKERKTFIMPCPMEACRGFLGTNYVCGLCTTSICKDCHRTKTEEHVCNPDEVATITELKQHTKPCPKCRIPIYKTEGCDQMFCIQCHTAFSWRTGQIESGVIHNPHYFEALRAGNIRDPRHRQDHGGCGPMPQYHTLLRMFRADSEEILFQIEFNYQQFSHHREVTLVNLARRPDRHADRLDYLMGKLDEKKFKQRTFVAHQKSLRIVEERQIMDSYVTIGEELFRSLTTANVSNTLMQFHTLRNVTYDAIVSLDKKFQHKGMVRPIDIKPY
jgi:hypothetical protein